MCGRGGGGGGGGGGKVEEGEEEMRRRKKTCPPLFVYNREAGAEWFNQTLTKSKRLESAYRFAGWLMGQAMNNRCELDVRFPRVLFTKLLEAGPFYPHHIF